MSYARAARPLRESIPLSGGGGHHHHHGGGGGGGWIGGPGPWGWGGGDTIVVEQTPSICPVIKNGKVVNYLPCDAGQGPLVLGDIIGGIPDWVVIGGAAVAAWMLLRKR